MNLETFNHFTKCRHIQPRDGGGGDDILKFVLQWEQSTFLSQMIFILIWTTGLLKTEEWARELFGVTGQGVLRAHSRLLIINLELVCVFLQLPSRARVEVMNI